VSHTTMSAGKLFVPQPSTSNGKGSISNSCTLRLADIQLMGQSVPYYICCCCHSHFCASPHSFITHILTIHLQKC